MSSTHVHPAHPPEAAPSPAQTAAWTELWRLLLRPPPSDPDEPGADQEGEDDRAGG